MKRYVIILISLLTTFLLNAQELELKIASYNLRFGEITSMDSIGDYISSLSADIVALQECDWATYRERAPRQNGVKFINVLAQKTGMFGLFGKAIDYKGGYYGIGILSRYPIVKSERVFLPFKENTEQRILLVSEIELPNGNHIIFASTHLEVSSSALRVQQTEFIRDYFKGSKLPVFVAGDMNAEPDSIEMKVLIDGGWKMISNMEKTFSVVKPSVKIDYIFYYGEWNHKVLESKVCTDSALSDHFPIYSKVILNY